jgi:hypothetical protein
VAPENTLLVSHILAGSLTHGGAEQSETMSSMGGLVRRLRQPLNEVLEIYEFVTNNDRFRNEAFNRGARIRTGDLTDPNREYCPPFYSRNAWKWAVFVEVG